MNVFEPRRKKLTCTKQRKILCCRVPLKPIQIVKTVILCLALLAAVASLSWPSTTIRQNATPFDEGNGQAAVVYGFHPLTNYSVTLHDTATGNEAVTAKQTYAWDEFSIRVIARSVPVLVALTIAIIGWGLRSRKPIKFSVPIAILIDIIAFSVILLVLGPASQQVIPFLRIWAVATLEQTLLLVMAILTCSIILVLFWKKSSLVDRTGLNLYVDVFETRTTPVGLYNYKLPKVGFELTNDSPISARVLMNIYVGEVELGLVSNQHGYYSGGMQWDRQPGTFWGNFTIPDRCKDSDETLRLQATVTVTDKHKKTHRIVRCFTYDRKTNNWFPEPTTWQNLRKRAAEKGYKL